MKEQTARHRLSELRQIDPATTARPLQMRRPPVTPTPVSARASQQIPTHMQIQIEADVAPEDEDDDDHLYDTRLPTSSRRYSMPQPRRTSAHVQPQQRTLTHVVVHRSRQRQTEPQKAASPFWQRFRLPRVGRLTAVGCGMLLTCGLVMAGTIGIQWWHTSQDDLAYGRPRTSQTDAVVGHGDSRSNPSHFLAINLNRQVEVIEFPGGDATRAKVYIGPVLLGDGQDLTPVTLSFADENHDGRPDMVVHIQNQKLVFLNEHGTFRLARAGEVTHV